jgi:hypothetical protein
LESRDPPDSAREQAAQRPKSLTAMGHILAGEALHRSGFVDIVWPHANRNYWGLLMASKGRERYIALVVTRTKYMKDGTLNERYRIPPKGRRISCGIQNPVTSREQNKSLKVLTLKRLKE